ncbi:MAG: hypothetical protein IPO92_14515 [Saprospiraceae bacterium]|nr:hypothetical protein [Saprospiraceae bacterium]
MLSKLLIPCLNTELGLKERSFFTCTYSEHDRIPSMESIRFAMITHHSILSQSLRIILENFGNHFNNIQIADLGYINNTETDYLEKIVHQLSLTNTIVFMVGCNLDDVISYIKKKKSDIHFICNNLPFISEKKLLSKNYLGYQRHLCSLIDIHSLEDSAFNSLSLGKLRSFPSQLEPSLRDVEVLYVNLNAVRSSETTNTIDAIPSGLNTEEMCQIFKNAGSSSNIKAVFIDSDLSHACRQESFLIAECIWYFIEGINMKINDHPQHNKDFSEFVVYSHSFDQDLSFLRNNQTHKWWLKTTSDNGKSKYLACSNEEYQQTINEELPDRILKFIHAHIK